MSLFFNYKAACIVEATKHHCMSLELCLRLTAMLDCFCCRPNYAHIQEPHCHWEAISCRPGEG